MAIIILVSCSHISISVPETSLKFSPCRGTDVTVHKLVRSGFQEKEQWVDMLAKYIFLGQQDLITQLLVPSGTNSSELPLVLDIFFKISLTVAPPSFNLQGQCFRTAMKSGSAQQFHNHIHFQLRQHCVYRSFNVRVKFTYSLILAMEHGFGSSTRVCHVYLAHSFIREKISLHKKSILNIQYQSEGQPEQIQHFQICKTFIFLQNIACYYFP